MSELKSKTLINYIIKDYRLNDDSIEELILPNCVYLISSFNSDNLKHVIAPNLKYISFCFTWNTQENLKLDAPKLEYRNNSSNLNSIDEYDINLNNNNNQIELNNLNGIFTFNWHCNLNNTFINEKICDKLKELNINNIFIHF